MKIIQAPRASAILYQLLMSRNGKQPWLLPANICPVVPLTFLKAGVPFMFVDISSETLLMDLEQAEVLMRTHGFGGLLYAHTYGEPSTPNEFFASTKTKFPDLLLVDDRCLCVPDVEVDIHNKSDVQLYSTGYAKVVELDFGGYAFAGDNISYQPKALPFVQQAYADIEKAYKQAINECVTFRYKDSDWLETEALMPSWHDYREKIKTKLVDSLKQRALLNAVYTARLPVDIQLPGVFQGWRFNICIQNKQRVLDAIFTSGLFASSHYASLAGVFGDGSGLHADRLANRVINLFNDHHFSLDQAEQVCKIVLDNL